MTDPALMKHFNFDQADLDLNRQGRFSLKQQEHLAKQQKASKGCSAILGVILLGVALLGIGIAIAGGVGFSQMDWTAAIIFGGAFGCIWPAVWGGIGFFFIKSIFTKVVPKLEHVQGPINIVREVRESTDSDNNTTQYSVYELRVGGRVFDVKSDTANLMMQSDVYDVYYADIKAGQNNPIMSVELIATARNA